MAVCDWLKEKELVVWGCGKIGKDFAKYAKELDIPISYYVDSDGTKKTLNVGDSIFQIRTPKDILSESREMAAHILVAVKEAGDIINQLRAWGIDDTLFTEWSSIKISLYDALYKKRFPYPHYQKKEFPIFKQVEIETINRCNNDCPFCPGNKHHDTRKLEIMNNELFESILRDLKNIGFDGNINLFGTNEPLLDPNIAARIKLTREILPNCYHFISTNGILLTLDLFKEIIPYVDEFVVDNYSDSGELLPNLTEIVEYVDKHPEIKSKTCMLMRLKNEVLTSRGGHAPNKQAVEAPSVTCSMPFEFLNIKSSGVVSLCCSDYLPEYNMGDLNEQSVLEIWRGERFQEVRKTLMEQGRTQMELCNKCDAFFMLRH